MNPINPENLQNIDKQNLSELLKNLKRTIDQSKNMEKLASFVPEEPLSIQKNKFDIKDGIKQNIPVLNNFKNNKKQHYITTIPLAVDKLEKIREQTKKLATSNYFNITPDKNNLKKPRIG